MTNPRLFTLVSIILAAAALRFAPLPPNFVPIGAMALFGGALLTQPRYAFAVPLAAMLISDLVMAGLWYGTAVFWGMPFVYAGFALYVVLGRFVRSRMTPLRIGTAAVAGSVLFFLITNFGSWLRGLWYPMTWEGLIACYAAGIPFFRNTLAADVLFTALLFGGFALAQHYPPVLRERQTPAPLSAHG
jgi:hypothetical protein